MSAGAVGVFVPQPVRMPSRTVRPRLRLVDSGQRVGPGERRPPGAYPSPGARADVLSSQAIRLARSGRLVITLIAAVAVTILAVAVANSVGAAGAQIDHATTVSAGQTLSEVAARQLPSLPIHNAVARIQLANGLSSSQVHAGQLLLIPKLP